MSLRLRAAHNRGRNYKNSSTVLRSIQAIPKKHQESKPEERLLKSSRAMNRAVEQLVLKLGEGMRDRPRDKTC